MNIAADRPLGTRGLFTLFQSGLVIAFVGAFLMAAAGQSWSQESTPTSSPVIAPPPGAPIAAQDFSKSEPGLAAPSQPASARSEAAVSTRAPGGTATATPATAPISPASVTSTASSVVGEATAGDRHPNLPQNLSPLGMFMAADWVVKAVMLGLAFASLVTWTVGVAKFLEIAGATARLRNVLRIISTAHTLDDAVGEIGQRGGPGAVLARAAAEEVKISMGALQQSSADGLKERVASRLSRIHAQAGRRLMRGTGILATIGATAPFVGLFGTVWGIMNSFIGISEAQTTNLAVVAPGIAEALLATAIGLVAAIPAVVIYNVFARSITGYRQALADAVAGVERLVSRDLDYRFAPASERPTAQSRTQLRPSLAAAAE